MQAGAVILAGGKSSRMGQNKALLPIDGISNIERIVQILRKDFTDISIVTNNKDSYEFLQLPMTEDRVKEKGPLAGIQAGLLASPQETNFFVACDMPFVSVEVAKRLVELSDGYDAVVPVIDGRQHPLFAVYKKSVLPELEKCLLANELRLIHLLDKVNTNYVTEAFLNLEIAKMDKVFYNMNHPSEYEEAKKIASEKRTENDDDSIF